MANEKILIVEDESVVSRDIENRLRKLGYTVVAAVPSAEAALVVAKKHAPDLVLMGLKLEGKMDGIEAADLVRSRFNIPVIYLFGHAGGQTLEQAKITGPFGYLMKPFDSRDLRTAIEMALYRHLMEKRLRESELRYRTLFEGAGDAIFILDAEGNNAGLIVEVNHAAAVMHGYTVEELRGLNIRDLDAPDAAGQATGLMEGMLQGEWIKKEINHRRKDNSIFPVEISAGLLVFDNHKYILAIDRDISDRRDADEALKAALSKAEGEKNKTEAIIAAMGDGISIQDTDFKVLYQNQVHKDIIGEHTGEYCYNAYERKKDVCEGCGIAESFKDGRIHKVERSAMTDRGRVYVEVTASPVRDSSGKIIAGIEIARDITQRKKAEEESLRNCDLQSVFNELLRISMEELSLQDVLQQALDTILSVSCLSLEAKGSIFLVGDEPDMLIMSASKGLSAHHLEKCSRIPFGRCMCGSAALAQSIQHADCVDDRHDISYAGMGPHGHYCIPFSSAGKVSGVMNLYIKKGHPRDERECSFLKAYANMLAGIVQRKRAEEERGMLIVKLQEAFETVKRSQKEWMGTFDSITDLIFISDVNYTIIRANRAFAEYFEMTPRHVIYKKCYELFNMTELIYSACPHAASLREQRMVQGEFIDQARGRIFMMTASPYCSQDGELVGSIISCKDVTAEKEREMRLIMSERLATLGQMASGIAHEINNPLAAIAGCTEGLLKRVEQERFEPEVFRNYLKIIEEEILRCKNITSGMLSFVRTSTYDKQDVDIHKILDKTIEMIGFQGRLKDVELIKDYKEGLPLIRGSEGELRQVFLAIIINALDAMEDRGTLSIATRIGTAKILIRITDSGPGIFPEHVSRIFDPFYTTKGEKGGTGLGLSIANKIVNNHSGSIEVSSEEGKGTAFIITLPI